MDEEFNSVELKKTGVENNGFIADQGCDEHAISGSRKNSQTEDLTYTVKLDSSEDPIPLKPYAGMSKDVLLHFSNQPCYKVTREILFWLIIIATLAIIAATITIIALSPKCLDWWQRSPIYQVYPKSFRDSNNDGSGDLKGIQEKIDHFVYLDVSTVWVAPFYKSTLKDYRYAVDDFRDVDPSFGTMSDFENLLAGLHDKGIKLIIDLIPNHTSNKHNWFNLSRNSDDKYTDYYIWKHCQDTGGQVTPPNNWVNVYGGSAWEYDDVRRQCYLHQFRKEQPDLNFHNPDVHNEILDIIKFWLEKGVDGFTIDAAKFLLEADHLRDEPQVNKLQVPTTIKSYGELYHDYTTTQTGMHDILRDFRQTMNTYSREPGRYRFMGTESDDGNTAAKTMLYYGNSFIQEADFPLNFYLFDLKGDISGKSVFDNVDLWMKSMPKGKWPHWMVGSPSNSRVASRVGTDYVKVINMLLITLPGTPTTYYGEELGMQDNPALNETKDPSGEHNPAENPEKTPMQWDTSSNSGFSGANKTWLPLNQDYEEINVEVQMSKPDSTLNLYREIIQLRKTELPLHRGWLCYVWTDDNVFAYVREIDGLNKVFMMVLNFGVKSNVNIKAQIPDLPAQAKVRLSTIATNNGKDINMNNINTERGEGLILEYKTDKPLHNLEAFKDKCFISEKACYSSAFDLLYNNC
ncbi:amino acid transporter heavy chain SLC3A1 [Rhinoderma darwinii]|uniref:amino acid transporter heavy chain SLC3A1 n=1 Tax=Rhinoderma darwinii TaxID=43563 RepID=UPI003F66DB2C